MYRLLRFVPKNALSLLVGRLVHFPLPQPLARWTIRRFAKSFAIDTTIASQPLESYPSLGAFFTRDLKEGLRKIEGEIVSPVDGTLRSYGTIRESQLEQVKGKSYSLASFLGENDTATSFDGGFFFNFYLAPQDYHHVHAPVTGRVVRSVHIPGKLWPVNEWSMQTIDGLFTVNERIVTYLEGAAGLVAVVMVGATNVGRMSVVYDTFVTNQRPRARAAVVRLYDRPHTLAAGARLGTFHMGSSVVLLFRPGIIDEKRIVLSQPSKVLYGQRLLAEQ